MTLMLVATTTPGMGADYIGKAWGWTVYICVGVWRCL